MKERNEFELKILVIVDMQKDFITGSLGSQEAIQARDYLVQWINKNINNEDYILFTKDTHYEDYLDTNEGKHLPIPHCIYRTEGWIIDDKIINAVANCDTTSDIIEKSTFGTGKVISNLADFIAYDLDENETLDEIIFCGLCTDICVISNALITKAEFPETNISVLAPACAGVTPEKHNAALTVMESCQITIREK